MTDQGGSAVQDSQPAPSLSWRKKLLFTIVAGLVVLGLAEVGLRIFWEPPPRFVGVRLREAGLFQKDADLGWIGAPDKVLVHNLYAGHECTVRMNSRGFRDLEQAWEPKAPGESRILVFGDSFPWGYGVEQDEAFPALLRKELPGTTVFNLGVTGYNLTQSHRLLERVGPVLKPDIVVLSVCQNDIGPDRIPPSSEQRAARGGGGVKAWLSEHVYLYQFARARVAGSRVLSAALRKIGLKDSAAGFDDLDENLRPALREYPPALRAQWDAAMQRLKAFAATAQGLGARFLVCDIPAKQALHPEELARSLAYVEFAPEDFDLAKPYAALRDFCASEHIAFVDLLGPFRQSKEELYLAHDMHFNVAGHALAARCIAAGLRAEQQEPGDPH